MKQQHIFVFPIALWLTCLSAGAQPINRQELVRRHQVVNQSFDTLASLTVGNGHFAFTVDATGLQSFPDLYANGVPLGTLSDWGWHRFPNPQGYRFEETLETYDWNGRPVSYSVQRKDPERSRQAVEYFRQNPHRLQLGNLGFEILKKDGTTAGFADFTDIHQTLDPWTGTIRSVFFVEGVRVEVSTACHADKDRLGISIRSALIQERRLFIRLRFPLPTGNWKDTGVEWDSGFHPGSRWIPMTGGVRICRRIDSTVYWAKWCWTGKAKLEQRDPNYFLLTPGGGEQFSFVTEFSGSMPDTAKVEFATVWASSCRAWPRYWQLGAAVDFSGSRDPRAAELERRVVLSQYLERVQCAGSLPPQETGLTYNSWYGRMHLEMYWWHALHFAAWGRKEWLEKSLQWFQKARVGAAAIARRQGYAGLRWQKMTDPEGGESPSSVGAFLIWQQPHLIFLAEMVYRSAPSKAILQRYSELVFATADFLASFPEYDSLQHRFVLGKGVMPAQERFRPGETFNPTYELVYWHWALDIAIEWRKRLGLPAKQEWANTLGSLSKPAIQGDKYLFAESAADSYSNPRYKTDHPAVLGTLGMLPLTSLVDTGVMKKTFKWIWDYWDWQDTWGWDFPMTAMTATRLGLPEKAVDALLMPVRTNTYLKNGHNYQDGRLTVYLPGNGGLLAAVALICVSRQGFPRDGSWKVRREGFKPIF